MSLLRYEYVASEPRPSDGLVVSNHAHESKLPYITDPASPEKKATKPALASTLPGPSLDPYLFLPHSTEVGLCRMG